MRIEKHHNAVIAANHRRKGTKRKSIRSGYIYVNNGLNQYQINPKDLDNWIIKGFKRGGLPKSKSHRKHISESLKKYSFTPQHRANLSKANSGSNNWCYGKPEINPMKGKHHSEETKHKISLAFKGSNHPLYGKHLSDDTKHKISKAVKGYKHSKLTIEHLRLAKLGKKQSEETRKKRSISMSLAIAKSNKFRSKQELECLNYLSNYFITKSQYRIIGSNYMHPYDIYVLLPNGIQLLIEFDGDYWHKDTNYKDDKREQVANMYGYGYIVIKGSDYNKYGKIILKEAVIAYCPEVEHYKLSDAPSIKIANSNIKPISYNKDVFLRSILYQS